MATGSETAVSPSGCLTFSEAIESAALAFLLKVDDEYDSFVDQSMETSLRSTTSSKSASPARTPRSPFLPNKLKLSGSRPIDARPNTARLYKSPRSGDAQQCTDLSRSTSGTKKISKLKRAVKKSSRH